MVQLTRGAYLNSFENVPEHRALLPLVSLGSVLVAVCGQCVKFITEFIPAIKFKILNKCKKKNAAYIMCSKSTDRTCQKRHTVSI